MIEPIINKIKQNTVQQVEMGGTTQQPFIQWRQLYEALEYKSSGVIGFKNTTLDCTKYVYKGQPLMFTQDGSTKYFYITNVTTTTISIYAGIDYTLTTSAISLCFVSDILSPLNFPHLFNFDPAIINTGGGFSDSTASKLYNFYMIKNRVYLNLYLRSANVTTGAGALELTLPIALSNTNQIEQPVIVIDAGTRKFGRLSLQSATKLRLYTDASSANFALTTGGCGFTIDTNYFV